MPIMGFDVGPEPALLLFAALLLDGLLPDTAWLFRILPHPVTVVGAVVRWLDRQLNREGRGARVLLVRGAVVVVAVAGGAALLGWQIQQFARTAPYGWVAELAVLVVLLAQRSLFNHVRAVARPLAAGDLGGARLAVGRIVGRDPAHLDAHGVARAAIESLAENFSDAVVAPTFWYLLLGLPGICAYKAADTLDSMIGHRSPRYRDFGLVAARLDDGLNLIPARLAGMVIALAAIFAPTANPWRAARVLVRDAGKHASVNAGWPEAAMAGALGFALAGPRRYADHSADDPWIGDGTARVGPADIHRALYLFAVACLVTAGLVGTFGLFKYGV